MMESGYDVSTPPELILESLIHELRHPLNSLDGWAKILEMAEMADLHQTAIQELPRSIAMIRNILEATLDYVEKRKALNAGKGDTES